MSACSSPLFSSVSIENKHINFITDNIPAPHQHAPTTNVTYQKRTCRFELKRPNREDKEAYELYSRFEENTFHHSTTPESFFSFLGDSTLHAEENMGTFWLKWYIDDKLIAVSVLDILPSTVVGFYKESDSQSSVYFFYDTDLKPLSLGILSGMKEINLAREVGLWMGFESRWGNTIIRWVCISRNAPKCVTRVHLRERAYYAPTHTNSFQSSRREMHWRRRNPGSIQTRRRLIEFTRRMQSCAGIIASKWYTFSIMKTWEASQKSECRNYLPSAVIWWRRFANSSPQTVIHYSIVVNLFLSYQIQHSPSIFWNSVIFVMQWLLSGVVLQSVYFTLPFFARIF